MEQIEPNKYNMLFSFLLVQGEYIVDVSLSHSRERTFDHAASVNFH